MQADTLNKYQKLHKQLIESAHGVVEDIFVCKTGVLLTKKSSVTSAAQQLFEQLNIDTSRPLYEQHAEFNSRLTYLSFTETKGTSAAYNERMIKEYGHRSVYNDEYVTFLVAGCALETELEFIAHNEAVVARLTSSKTNAQNAPLFKLLGDLSDTAQVEKQKTLIRQYLHQKNAFRMENTPDYAEANEIWNTLAPGNKAVSFTITMSVKDWHKTLIGRLSKQGVESDMLEVLEEVARQLKEQYPIFFNTIAEYYQMGNEMKYKT